MPIYPMYFIWVVLLFSRFVIHGCDPCSAYRHVRRNDQKFEQKTNRFWKFEGESNGWVEVKLPYDLYSCNKGTCTKVGSIDRKTTNPEEPMKAGSDDVSRQQRNRISKKDDSEREGVSPVSLPFRKRVSLTKMTETSIWITGQSGSIYERFWNGLQWVIAPHDLPLSAGYATSVFVINQTILALSEAGDLYQLQLNENSQPIWVGISPKLSLVKSNETEEETAAILFKSGVISHHREWIDHGRPPGANVAAIADAAAIRKEVIFTISSAGDLYEYDINSKPAWKKHIQKEEVTKDTSLKPSIGRALHGLGGVHATSLFLVTKSGNLVERRLQKRKWKWIFHGSPENHHLTAITLLSQDELNDKMHSLFLTTISGFLFEYQMPKHSGIIPENQIIGKWVNHKHPPHARVAQGISGLQFQVGRIIFPLDDGRLAELHLSGLGGESSGPTHQVNARRKASHKFLWSIIDAPETEGWNAEYCSAERGLSNCITGVKDGNIGAASTRATPRKRKGSKEQDVYLSPSASGNRAVESGEVYNMPDNWINLNFRLRLTQEGRSFFLITDGGLALEYLHVEDMWIWLRHEHVTSIEGALGNFNGSLFFVDEHGSLLIRERNNEDLEWKNCTAMRKGRHVIGGPPWDRMTGRAHEVAGKESLFFVSRCGRLLQLTVGQKKYRWKDCRTPATTKIASIVDQEVFRENIVYAIGRNGRLYQYNRVTELWHEHYQSQHLILSRVPGTSARLSPLTLTGSLFMFSEVGGLVEYHWNSMDGWDWIEHGTPSRNVTLVGSPGPCFQGNQLFLIGSDGNVYLRFFDQGSWKWNSCGFPNTDHIREAEKQVCLDRDIVYVLRNSEEKTNAAYKENCNEKVARTRPIAFTADSVIFELRDGRLGELRRVEDMNWEWSRIVGTPASLCAENYWTALVT